MGTDDAQYRSGIHDCAAGLVLGQGEILEFGTERRRLSQSLSREAGRDGGSTRATPADNARTIGTSSSGNGPSRAVGALSAPIAIRASGATGTLSFQSRW
jgi:hypothetical protein